MDIDKLTHAVDRARIQSYAQFGKVYDIDAEQFANLMAVDLGIDLPTVDAPQPPVEVVAKAEITDDEDLPEETYVEHVFRSDRGGVDCITCHLPGSEGNHSS